MAAPDVDRSVPGRRFWDWIAPRYARTAVADEAAYQRKLAVTREHLGPRAEVLELGCGTGSTAIAHAPFVGHVLATDLSERMIEIARGKAQAAGARNVSFRRTSLEAFEAADGAFDAVMCHSLLHLIADRGAAMAKVARLLTPGGAFVSSTACLGDHMAWFRHVGPIGAALGVLPPVRVFTADALVAEIEGAGFEVVHRWRPGPKAALFVVARRPGAPGPEAPN